MTYVRYLASILSLLCLFRCKMIRILASGDDPKVHPSQAADAEEAKRLSTELDSDVTGAEEQVMKQTPEKPKKDEGEKPSSFSVVTNCFPSSMSK